jgi:RNA polymerase sigma-70 factor, ECF subfamily
MSMSYADVVTVDNAGDQAERFRTLARDQLPRLYSIARRLVGDDAEDVVQDCLLKAFQGFDQLHETAAAPAWLTRILINCCRDCGRAIGRSLQQIELDEVEGFSLFRKIASGISCAQLT